MTKFLCDLPWVHLSIMPHGTSSICCVADHSIFDSSAVTKNRRINASKEAVINIINSDSYKKIRLQMINDEVPAACMTCKKVEDVGGVSKRIRDGMKYGLDHQALTSPDGSISPALKDIELRLGNYCNLRCRSCNAESSTSWIQDYNKLKNIIPLPSSYDTLQESPDTDYAWCESDVFYTDLINAAPDIDALHISGGEPFLVPKHFNILKLLIERGKTNLKIHYITNLNYNFDKIKPALNMLTKFASCNISFSIDDVDARNTYIRNPSNWELTIKNLKRFLTEYPNFNYSITQTINAYNFMYCEELYLYLKTISPALARGIYYNHIHAPEYLSSNVLPKQMRQDKLHSIKDILPDALYQNLHGRYYNSAENNLLEVFKKVTSNIDAVRSENVIDTFPKLKTLFE